MTSEQIQELALTLYAVVFEGEGIAELEVWYRCLRACQCRDVEPRSHSRERREHAGRQGPRIDAT